MKRVLIFSGLATLLLSASDCSNKTSATYKGRLEIKAICSNYTISVIEGDIDTSKVVANWTDENTGKSYKNVFKLGSPCTFPSTLNAGDEFFFTIDTSKEKECMVCMAYYPTPPKALPIVVKLK